MEGPSVPAETGRRARRQRLGTALDGSRSGVCAGAKAGNAEVHARAGAGDQQQPAFMRHLDGVRVPQRTVVCRRRRFAARGGSRAGGDRRRRSGGRRAGVVETSGCAERARASDYAFSPQAQPGLLAVDAADRLLVVMPSAALAGPRRRLHRGRVERQPRIDHRHERHAQPRLSVCARRGVWYVSAMAPMRVRATLFTEAARPMEVARSSSTRLDPRTSWCAWPPSACAAATCTCSAASGRGPRQWSSGTRAAGSSRLSAPR